MSRINRRNSSSSSSTEAAVVQPEVVQPELPTLQAGLAEFAGEVATHQASLVARKALAEQERLGKALAAYAEGEGTVCPKPHKGGGEIRHATWNGFSGAALLRWLGANGYTTGQCKALMGKLGIGVSVATVKTQRQCGKAGKGCKLPALTDEHKAELAAMLVS